MMECVQQRRPVTQAVALALFVLPALYVSAILSTAVHEILGHGFCAMLLGGEFSGFVLKWDAMGWAYSELPESAPLSHHIFFSASGIIANLVFGGMLLGFAFIVSPKPHVQLMLLVVSFTCLIDGISYVLWNAYHPDPSGDIGRIIWLLWSGPQPPEDLAIRWVLLVGGALIFFATVFFFSTAVFIRVEAVVLGPDRLKGRSRVLALLLFLVLPSLVGWFSFDWNQLVPGIGLLPNMTGVLCEVTAATLLFWYRPRWTCGNSARPIPVGHILVSWMCLTATVLVVALWATDGVSWR
ncbi:MAG TPA: M50 family metallopeptidase [bacterium]|nr:M50 family metallopeptidase [bacterium]